MRYKETFILAATAVVALLAFAGTASATTLTSPSGTTYTGELRAASTFTKLTSSFIGSISCTESTMTGKVEKHGSGVTAGGKISTLTFTGCSGGSPTSPVAKPGSLEVHGTATTGNGTVTSSGAEVIVHNTLAGTCTFSTETATDIGTLEGSNLTKGTAFLHINGVAIRTAGSGFCGESATWTGTYAVTRPITLEVH